jgi:glycosyltransferase involved in cell wall biosynthesis
MNTGSAPLVSVVVPCYRQGRYLGAAVRSALAQTHPALEVIVVDDGSDDDSADVARSFGNHITFLQRANGGPCAARNTGLAAAGGEYVLFLDADDILRPELVTSLLLAAEGRDDVVCVCGIRLFERDDDLTSGAEVIPNPTDRLEYRLLINNLNPPIAFLCSRRMVAAVGGWDESLPASEDWELWLRLLFAGATFVAVPHVGAYYRQHPTSNSRSEIRMARTRAEVVGRTLRHLRRNPEMVRRIGADPQPLFRQLRAIITNEHLAAAYLLRNAGQYRAALSHYLRSAWTGRLNATALTGALKLVPHWLRGDRAPARS